jgi:hypothetical protein
MGRVGEVDKGEFQSEKKTECGQESFMKKEGSKCYEIIY